MASEGSFDTVVSTASEGSYYTGISTASERGNDNVISKASEGSYYAVFSIASDVSYYSGQDLAQTGQVEIGSAGGKVYFSIQYTNRRSQARLALPSFSLISFMRRAIESPSKFTQNLNFLNFLCKTN